MERSSGVLKHLDLQNNHHLVGSPEPAPDTERSLEHRGGQIFSPMGKILVGLCMGRMEGRKEENEDGVGMQQW